MRAGRDEIWTTPGELEGSRFWLLSDPLHDRAKNLDVTERRAAGGSRERLHAWITRAVFYRLDQTKTLQVVAASGDGRGSRPPTRTGPAKPNVPTALVQLRTVKSGSRPGAGQELVPTAFAR